METKIIKIPEDGTERVVVECHRETPTVNAIVRFVQSMNRSIRGELNESEYEIGIQDILYIESVDNRTFLYTADEVYRVRERLYELENMLLDASFLRISKGVVVNLLKIVSIKPALNGRFAAVLTNNEEVIISRKYVPDLKKKIRGDIG
ncbi:MAG: LytTR family transcriptional regulator [Lachnospiraceae bacterium]|nr:LytTR family transcriptional regulator [Candidatus Colinaster equi]